MTVRYQLQPVDHMKRAISHQVDYVEPCDEKPSCGALVLDDPLLRRQHAEFHDAQANIDDAVEEAVAAHVERLNAAIEDLKSTTDTRLDGFRQQIESAASEKAQAKR